MEFNNIDWHDSVIEQIIIDRKNPGKNDTIQISVCFNNIGRKNLVFKNVYWANIDMNFGIVSHESILKAFSEEKSNIEVKNLYLKWKGLIDDIDLNYYEIETNSTNSRIKIIAKGFELK